MENSDINIKDKWDRYRNDGQIEFITFHPSYSYEEFIEGITVNTDGENIPTKQLEYVLKPGIFKDLCKRALGGALGIDSDEVKKLSWQTTYNKYLERKKGFCFSKAPRFVLIIDEINRGDIAKILGELITLLEVDKRIGADNELIVTLPYSKDSFGVPPNVYIVGTMNTADRSIALLDVALRRRFGFIEMNPNFEVLRAEHLEKNKEKLGNGVYDLLGKSIKAVQEINTKICQDKTVGRDKQIGQSFFFKVFSKDDLILVWKHEILPLLEEYFYSDYNNLNRILFNEESDTKWIKEAKGIQDIDNIDEMLDEILKNG